MHSLGLYCIIRLLEAQINEFQQYRNKTPNIIYIYNFLQPKREKLYISVIKVFIKPKHNDHLYNVDTLSASN